MSAAGELRPSDAKSDASMHTRMQTVAAMICRNEAEIMRLVVTPREKFLHSLAWDSAFKRVIWRSAWSASPKPSVEG
jgi:hypothetical protein